MPPVPLTLLQVYMGGLIIEKVRGDYYAFSLDHDNAFVLHRLTKP